MVKLRRLGRSTVLTINQYVKAESLEQAYELNQKKNHVILGGMLWLKMQNRTVGTAIDLSGLGLNQIEETTEGYKIGAMVTLRQLEQHSGLRDLTQGAITESVKHIVGVQFRNLATIGGSIFGRYGFSDVLTLFMALDAQVELYHKGIISIEEFVKMPYDNDILVHIILKQNPMKVVYLSQRNTKTDFPVLTCAMSQIDHQYRCVIGARPNKAMCVMDQEGILENRTLEETIDEMAEKFAEYVAGQVTTGSNLRASSEYRSILVKVLTKRAVLQLMEIGGNS